MIIKMVPICMEKKRNDNDTLTVSNEDTLAQKVLMTTIIDCLRAK